MSSCNKKANTTGEPGVIVSEKAKLNNSTALVAAPIKELKRGETVEILEQKSVNQVDYTRVRISG
ncbi:MAG: hypothetical protein JNN15_12125, partial [Blastocatellia bacterium]|nr:hypothetical protein [Blastocatellia bacterium]